MPFTKLFRHTSYITYPRLPLSVLLKMLLSSSSSESRNTNQLRVRPFTISNPAFLGIGREGSYCLWVSNCVENGILAKVLLCRGPSQERVASPGPFRSAQEAALLQDPGAPEAAHLPQDRTTSHEVKRSVASILRPSWGGHPTNGISHQFGNLL